MEHFACTCQQYYPAFSLPQLVPYPGVGCAMEASGYTPFAFGKVDFVPPIVGSADACAEVETDAPSDSDGRTTTEDDECPVAGPCGVALDEMPKWVALDEMPKWVHCPGTLEPRWLPPPSGLDARLLRPPPAWAPAEPAVLADLPALYSTPALGGRRVSPGGRGPAPAPVHVHLGEPAPATISTTGAGQGEAARPAPKHGLSVTAEARRTRAVWTIDAKKLQSKDQVIVSPRFDVRVGGQPVPFKMMLCPKAVSDKRGGNCFKKARGVGFVQLKCEAGGAAPTTTIAFALAVGGGPRRGPVMHNFEQEGVAGLPEEQRHWDLVGAVDRARQTLTVELEALQLDR